MIFERLASISNDGYDVMDLQSRRYSPFKNFRFLTMYDRSTENAVQESANSLIGLLALQLDLGKEPLRFLLPVKSSNWRFGNRKIFSGNFPCKRENGRSRDVNDDDRFIKE